LAVIGPTLTVIVPAYVLSSSRSPIAAPGMHPAARGTSSRNAHTSAGVALTMNVLLISRALSDRDQPEESPMHPHVVEILHPILASSKRAAARARWPRGRSHTSSITRRTWSPSSLQFVRGHEFLPAARVAEVEGAAAALDPVASGGHGDAHPAHRVDLLVPL